MRATAWILLRTGALQIFPTRKSQDIRELSPPTDAQVQVCVGRMRAWATLAKAVAEAEFPDFSVCNAFACFSLAEGQSGPAPQEGTVDKAHCERLGKVFGVDSGDLAIQLLKGRPLAQAIKNDSKCTNHEAWRQVLERKTWSKAFPNSALEQVALRYLVWSSSTAGVEQRFSVGDRLAVERSPAGQVTESLVLRAAFDKRPAEENRKVCIRAQELYATGCAQTRGNRGGTRIDKGVKRPARAILGKTERDWMKRRRVAVGAAKAQGTATPGRPLPAVVWAAGHEKCLEKQTKKREDRKVEAYQDGALLETEVTQELKDKVATVKEKGRKSDLQRQQRARRHEQRIAMMGHVFKWEPVAGKSVWLPDNLPVGCKVVARAHLQQRGLRVLPASEWKTAEVFVVPSLETMGGLQERVQWRTSLCGGWLLSLGVAKGGRGAFLKREAAICQNRVLWLTPRFAEKHQGATTLLREAVRWPGSRWQLADTAAAFVAAAKAKQGRGVWVLVRKGEAVPEEVRAAKPKCLTASEFLDHITVVDVGNTGGT